MGLDSLLLKNLIAKDSEITVAKVWGGKIDEVALGPMKIFY